jgi:hypothetical protein
MTLCCGTVRRCAISQDDARWSSVVDPAWAVRLVRQLAAEGCDVAECDVSEESLDEPRTLAQKSAPTSTRVTTFVADVTDEAQ